MSFFTNNPPYPFLDSHKTKQRQLKTTLKTKHATHGLKTSNLSVTAALFQATKTMYSCITATLSAIPQTLTKMSAINVLQNVTVEN